MAPAATARTSTILEARRGKLMRVLYNFARRTRYHLGSMEIAFGLASSTSDVAMEPSTVLIVDDDRAVLNALSELLENEGYAVATAMDGLDALNQLRGGLRPCVILLDLMMPRMDGWDFRHEQLNDPHLKDLPVVIITAAGFSEASVKAQFGDIEFVAKPPPEKGLLEAIRRCCGEPIH